MMFEKMKEKLLNETSIECIILVHKFFKDDGGFRKTALWFNTPNPLLGDTAPFTLIFHGREDRLLKFIKNALAGDIA